LNARDLPLVGCISNSEKDIFGSCTNLAKKKVLCIGFSETEVKHLVDKYEPSKIILLTNWADHEDARVKKFPLVVGDITKRTQFPDNSFDAVLTLSVLEHLLDLDGAFDEMTRLLKNGGEMIHMFGPAWSCAYGHHIYENPDDKLLNFSRWQMPAHMHLLCSHQDIISYYLEMGYPASAGHAAIHWFYETPIINRVFYDDYMKIFEEDRFQIDRMEIMYNALPRDHIERLRDGYPGRRDFSAYGGKYKLVVRK
jgi:ubiquinone/menaquinone biosynthesis C-methylase UbiE